MIDVSDEISIAGNVSRFVVGDASQFVVGDASQFVVGDASQFVVGDASQFVFGNADVFLMFSLVFKTTAFVETRFVVFVVEGFNNDCVLFLM
jgi:hypothetical protein